MAQRGPYAKGLAKREEILQRALELFAVHGYDRVSVREIARACGLSQAGLLHHFSGKEELFLAVLRRRDDRHGPVTEAGQVHGLERLFSAVQGNVNEPGLVRLFVSMSAESTRGDGPTREFFDERYAGLTERVAGDVRARQEAGEATSLDADDAAALLVAAADGLQLQWLLEPERVDMVGLLRELWQAMRESGQGTATTSPTPSSATSSAATTR